MGSYRHRMLTLKVYITGLLLLTGISIKAQISSELDTIEIKEVIITHKKVPADLIGFKSIAIDSSVTGNFSHETLADLLAQSSDISVKSYGVGGSATPSFRGTSASQTQLQWNNISINNPMLGQADLSLIPVGLIDKIDIYYGGSSMPAGNGGIGGTINLQTKPVWNNNTTITLNPGAGSFGHYSGVVKVRTGSLSFQSVTKAYMQYAENNFSFLNDVSSAEPVWEIRRNNQTFQKGLLQELYYRKLKNVLSARLWYQSADRNLPASILIQQPDGNEKQLDESLRTIINYDGFKGLTEYFIAGSFSVSKLDYSNKLASIDSRNLSEMLILKAGLVNNIGQYVRTKITIDNENTLVKSENYEDNRTGRNVVSVTALAEVNGSGRFGATFLFREIINNNSILLPDYSTGLQMQIAAGREYYLKANYSRNSKLPSMNDLYWAPGGNPSLMNESANMFEIIYEMKEQIYSPLYLNFDIALYHNTIKNMIQWLPGNYAYWMAENVKSVNTSGLESELSFSYTHNKISSILNLSYTYTRATTKDSEITNDESIGKQLIYVPENQANAALRFNYSGFYSNWISSFTGRRYTTLDNTSYLPAYFINSLSVGYGINHKDNLYNLSLTADNIFSTGYEAIAYYPQPGRSFSLKLLIQFIK
ncbi:MAG TPA: hypothetical protein DCP74_14955 [Bacteroidales bacterium]|nr:hypothetical protein [Bacteroidales bacterium]